MFTIYILNYSNYYTRVIRKESTLSDYMPYVIATIPSANFYRGDGIDTVQTVRIDQSEIGDYLIVADGLEILSRWFIVDADATNKGTAKLRLHRDIVADRLDEISSQEAIIEKCSNIPTDTDIAIYNKEPGMSFNQIKTAEHLLKDDTGVAWIVGYVAREFPKEDSIQVETKVDPTSYDFAVNDLSSWPFYSAVKTVAGVANPNYSPYMDVDGEELTLRVSNSPIAAYDQTWLYEFYYKVFSLSNMIQVGQTASNIKYKTNGNLVQSYGNNILSYDASNYLEYTKAIKAAFNIPEANNAQSVLSLGTRVVKVGQGESVKYYRITAVVDSVEQNSISDANRFPRLQQSVVSCLNRNYVDVLNNGAGSISVMAKVKTMHLELVEENIRVTMPITKNRANLKDAPYDMFCMPYDLNDTDAINVESIDGSFAYTNSNEMNIAIAVDMFSKMGGGVYDIQIVPYCPLLQGVYQMDNGKFVYNSSSGNYSVAQTQDGRKIAAVFWCTRSTFRKQIEVPNAMKTVASLYDESAIDLKIRNETQKFRLVSPNNNGAFDFSVIENRGVDGFIADCTYKPYNPYIHVAMRFGGLYGGDFNDPRGLICNGDFSITLITSAWESYEVQNKNYENIFNRQIKSLELQNNWNRASDIYGALVGTAGTAASGAFTGAMLGGSIPGAIVGATAGAASGALDIYAKEQLRRDNISLQKDMHQYQLGNIRALPNSISKVSSISRNNKYVPFIEVYESTSTERVNLRKYIQYSGATIERIETIDYFRTGRQIYIKGILLTPKVEYMEFHELNALATEFKQGIYIV